MGRARVALTVTVVTALLMISGNVRAQPFFDNPELADVVDAVFTNSTKSGFSVVVAAMNGGSGILYPRFNGYHWGSTKNGNSGLIVFELYEADDIKRQGAGSWQMKQSDFAQFAFWLSSPGGGFSSGSPSYSAVHLALHLLRRLPLQLTRCGGSAPRRRPSRDATAASPPRTRTGTAFPKRPVGKPAATPRLSRGSTSDDQKLFKKVVGGLKGKGELPAYWGVNY